MAETVTTEKAKSSAKKSAGAVGPVVRSGSAEARRLSALILEVLAGARTPTDAASALGMSVPRYYQLEVRALEALVSGCEPRSGGPHRSAEHEVAILRKEVTRLEQESLRHRALLRMSQRAIGVAAPKPLAAKGLDDKSKRSRKPTVRALKASSELAGAAASTPTPLGDNQKLSSGTPVVGTAKGPVTAPRFSEGV